MKQDTIQVPIESHFAGDYRLEYDGKYITLFGRDKNYPQWQWSTESKTEDQSPYEEMVLISCVEEVRHASPVITAVDNEFITIKLNVSKI